MILVFSTGFTGAHHQAFLLSERMKSRGVAHHIVDAHDLINTTCCLVQSGNAIHLEVAGREVRPSAVYMMNRWRSDSIIRIPEGVTTPNAYRMQSHQFLHDLRFSLDTVPWIPGTFDNIERAESKPTLLSMANRLGLAAPSYTRNSSSIGTYDHAGAYKKNLGAPFVVSYSAEDQQEIGIEITGRLEGDSSAIAEPGMYQWQEPICASWQVRAFVVGDRIWAVRLRRKEVHEDLRARTSEEQHLAWEPYEIPSPESVAIRKLMSHLQITVAAPEFLIDSEGRHVFIDINPCGDWLGFFTEQTTNEIVDALCDHSIQVARAS